MTSEGGVHVGHHGGHSSDLALEGLYIPEPLTHRDGFHVIDLAPDADPLILAREHGSISFPFSLHILDAPGAPICPSVSYPFLFFAQLTHVWRHTAILERLAS